MKTITRAVCATAGMFLMSMRAPAQVDIYTKADIEAAGRTLSPKGPISADKSLARYGNHYLLMAKREETGSAEVHEHEADIFVIESGAATLQTGGKLVKGRITKPGEIRGTNIEGGERHKVAAGDIIHIPAGTPHQLLLTKGEPVVYFVAKITGQ